MYELNNMSTVIKCLTSAGLLFVLGCMTTVIFSSHYRVLTGWWQQIHGSSVTVRWPIYANFVSSGFLKKTIGVRLILLDLELPSFNTIIHDYHIIFNVQWLGRLITLLDIALDLGLVPTCSFFICLCTSLCGSFMGNLRVKKTCGWLTENANGMFRWPIWPKLWPN